MQVPQFLLYIRNINTHEFEYRNNVESVSSNGRLYSITFRGGRSYNYGFDKARYYPLIRTRENVRVYINGRVQGAVTTCYDYGDYYIFAGTDHFYKPTAKCDSIEVVERKENIENALLTLEYFKNIASSVVATFAADGTSEQGQDVNKIGAEMVSNALDRIDLEESRSAFSAYIDGAEPTITHYNRHLIFPFGCNESQRRAVESAVSSNLSIIEGPPGTGKTQTILNIIANAIYDGRSVAVVSNNNSAVQNVQEKLSRKGYGSIVASLGNDKNRRIFFGAEQHLDRFGQYKLTTEQIDYLDSSVSTLSLELEECFTKRNRVAQAVEQLAEAQNEQRHLHADQRLGEDEYAQIDKKFHRALTQSDVLSLRNMLSKGKLSVVDKFILLFKYRFFDILHLDAHMAQLPIYLNHKFYALHIDSIQREIDELNQWLEGADEQKKLQTLIDQSARLFGSAIADRYSSIDNIEFDINGYKGQFDDFVKRYPVVTSSTLSLHTSAPKDYLFDYLIIDEASQVDIIKASICFAFARRVIVVGDSCQLSHIVGSESGEIAERLQAKYEISEAYNYVTKSILSSLKTLYAVKIPTTLLKEHYRCHPDIIGFCNKRYYNNELIVMTQREADAAPAFTIIETSIGGAYGTCNQRQIDETQRYIEENFADDYCRVGIVSPYRKHADMLQSQLPKGCEADTIHKFQGRENDVIIFNTVANNINAFIDNPNLINVAVSRAVQQFVVVKPRSMELVHGTNIGDLIRYICYNYEPDEVVESGKICSVFDLLYKEYNRVYVNFATKNGAVGGSPAEVIMHKLLDEILQDPQFSSVIFAREYRLSDLVCDESPYSAEELAYIKLARLDFLLYNKIDCSPIMAIEVDGVSFHQEEKQQARDAKKDHVMQILQLPLLRLATNGHDERDKIIESLRTAMGVVSSSN